MAKGEYPSPLRRIWILGGGKLHPTFQVLLAKEASLFHSLILINIVDHIT